MRRKETCCLNYVMHVFLWFQVLYLTSLNLHPQKKQGRHVVTAKDLGLAINPVEGQLASHVSSSPTLNFLVYIPKVIKE